MADWFINELAKSAPAPRPHSITPEYLLPAPPSPRPNENATRILFVEHAATVQDFQELATLMRTIAEVRRVFTYNTPRALAVRGISDQLAFIEWLFNELDQPGHAVNASARYVYAASPDPDNTAQIFYLPTPPSVQDFQKIVTAIRIETGIRRVFIYKSPRAMAVRATGDQLDRVQSLLAERDPADFPKP